MCTHAHNGNTPEAATSKAQEACADQDVQQCLRDLCSAPHRLDRGDQCCAWGRDDDGTVQRVGDPLCWSFWERMLHAFPLCGT